MEEDPRHLCPPAYTSTGGKVTRAEEKKKGGEKRLKIIKSSYGTYATHSCALLASSPPLHTPSVPPRILSRQYNCDARY